MTSHRQFEANHRNARMSTGPKTEEGKWQSRRNAFRHGLTAETVIEILEDIEDYQAFEATIIADYDAHTAVERELVLRLASLLWRIRRATSIETDLLRIQAEILCDRRNAVGPVGQPAQAMHNGVYRFLKTAIRLISAIIREMAPPTITVRLLVIHTTTPMLRPRRQSTRRAD
jgi:hypothetical protein